MGVRLRNSVHKTDTFFFEKHIFDRNFTYFTSNNGNILLRKQYLRIESTVTVLSAIVVVYHFVYGVGVRGSVLGTFPYRVTISSS